MYVYNIIYYMFNNNNNIYIIMLYTWLCMLYGNVNACLLSLHVQNYVLFTILVLHFVLYIYIYIYIYICNIYSMLTGPIYKI